MELRYHTPVKGLILSIYFGAGHVQYTKDGSDGSETLRGWGLALTFNRENDWFARLDYARRIGTPSVMSNDAWSRDRLWFILGKNF